MKKHILFFLENLTYPEDPRVPNEAVAALNFGCEVSVICPRSRRYPLKYERIDGVDVYRHPFPTGGDRKLAFLFEYFSALFWEFLFAIWLYIKKPFHIIHAASPPDTICFVALFFRILGVKFIFDHHDLSPELYLSKFSRTEDILYRMLILCEKLSCTSAHAIISTNESYKRIILTRHSIDLEKIFVVRNDPSINECLVKVKNDDENKVKRILYLGGINTQDGVDVLLQALHYLVNDLNEKAIICNIIGDGDSLQSVKNYAKELSLEHFVDFKGWITSREEIRQYLYLTDICVEPAPDNPLNRHSTFIKIMEYMAAGKPVVAFDLVETRYSTNNSAILVTPGDTVGFAKAIKTLIHEPQLRQSLGKSGLERIKRNLNWEKSSLKLREAYNSLSL